MRDPWLDPNLVECSCGPCQRGGQCRSMRQLHEQQPIPGARADTDAVPPPPPRGG